MILILIFLINIEKKNVFGYITGKVYLIKNLSIKIFFNTDFII